MEIAFYPSILNAENDFTLRTIEAIAKCVPTANIINFPSYRDLKQKKLPNVVWLNWYENFPASRKSFIKEIIKKVHIIHLLNKHKIKIYTVFHNKRPHESRFPKLNLWFFKFLLRKSDKIIILSEGSKINVKELIGENALNKVVKISHPSYDIKGRDAKKSPVDFTVLFSGFLRPYKNIELIFELAQHNPSIRFIVAGRAYNDIYLQQLQEKSKNITNLELFPYYQDDEHLENLISRSSIMILPYNKNSSLNSGMLFYAFSKGINVIIPRIASVNEFVNIDDIYHYDYSDETEHLSVLEDTLVRAYKEWKEEKNNFNNKSIRLQAEVSKYTVDYLAKQINTAGLLD